MTWRTWLVIGTCCFIVYAKVGFSFFAQCVADGEAPMTCLFDKTAAR